MMKSIIFLSLLAKYALAIPPFTYKGDAPYSEPITNLSQALDCPYGPPVVGDKAVLLVSGTGSTGNESWGEGYVPALKQSGYLPCYVDLPNRALGDMQVSAEYVAYNLHQLSFLAGNSKVAVISHSQGGPDTQWALHFWPSTHNITRAFVALAPDFSGLSDSTDVGCVPVSETEKDCQPCLWQQAKGSNFYKALNYKGYKAQVPTTVVWTAYDYIIMPAEQNAQLPGAVVIAVQEVCATDEASHFTMVIDPAVYALAIDALEHGGHASVARVIGAANAQGGACSRQQAPGMQATILQATNSEFDALIVGLVLGGPKVEHEPPLMKYAQISNQ